MLHSYLLVWLSNPDKVPLTDYFFASFPDNKQLCPVETLRQYQSVTAPLRSDSDQLLIAIIKPHKPVASYTIAHWLKEVLKMAGVDINIFMAHSTRSASSSAAADSGITSSDILKAVDWSTESVFRKFYYTDPLMTHCTFGQCYLLEAVRPNLLHCIYVYIHIFRTTPHSTSPYGELQTTPLICETEPSEI